MQCNKRKHSNDNNVGYSNEDDDDDDDENDDDDDDDGGGADNDINTNRRNDAFVYKAYPSYTRLLL